MSYFNYKGKRIYFEEHGSGEPLLLLHGNTVSGKFFAPVIPMFASKYHVIIPDFLGCGQSDRIDKWPADLWYEWSCQVASLCKELDITKVKLIGCSGGALVAINVALEHPDLVACIVADSFEGVKADPEITDQIRAGRRLAKENLGFRSVLAAMHGEDWERVLDSDTEAVVAHAKEIGDFFHKSSQDLQVNCLLIGSAEDEMFPEGHYGKLFTDICHTTNYARSQIFDHGGHPAMMSNIKEFVSIVERFFNETERDIHVIQSDKKFLALAETLE